MVCVRFYCTKRFYVRHFLQSSKLCKSIGIRYTIIYTRTVSLRFATSAIWKIITCYTYCPVRLYTLDMRTWNDGSLLTGGGTWSWSCRLWLARRSRRRVVFVLVGTITFLCFVVGTVPFSVFIVLSVLAVLRWTRRSRHLDNRWRRLVIMLDKVLVVRRTEQVGLVRLIIYNTGKKVSLSKNKKQE